MSKIQKDEKNLATVPVNVSMTLEQKRKLKLMALNQDTTASKLVQTWIEENFSKSVETN